MSKNCRIYWVSSTHGIFTKIDHMLGHRSSLDKFKETETIQYVYNHKELIQKSVRHRNSFITILWIKKKSQKNEKIF